MPKIAEGYVAQITDQSITVDAARWLYRLNNDREILTIARAFFHLTACSPVTEVSFMQ